MLYRRAIQTTDPLTTLFSHHLWANLRLLECCAGLNTAQLDATIPGAYGSIRETLEHFVYSEKSYFSRFNTGTIYHRPRDVPPLTLDEMKASLLATGSGFVEWAPKVQAGDTVEIDWHGTLRQIPRAILLTQAINHATEHRAQIMAILTNIGVESPDLQAWAYFEELLEKEA